MARNEDMERRLLNWARWMAGMRGGGLGYASASMESRVAGDGWDAQSIIPTSDIEASETDEAIRTLPEDLQQTVTVCYLDSGGRRRHAERLGISESAIKERLGRVHAKLAAWYAERAAQSREQRSRVEALQQAARPKGPQPPPGPLARRVARSRAR